MRYLNSYNESNNNNEFVFILTIKTIEGGENYNETSILEQKCFRFEIDAVDYIIKYINKEWDQKFEPMKEEDTRLFSRVEDNSDYKKALEFVRKDEHWSNIKTHFNIDKVELL